MNWTLAVLSGGFAAWVSITSIVWVVHLVKAALNQLDD